eukprot:6523517-Pyramimonas_sp.AAC.1
MPRLLARATHPGRSTRSSPGLWHAYCANVVLHWRATVSQLVATSTGTFGRYLDTKSDVTAPQLDTPRSERSKRRKRR